MFAAASLVPGTPLAMAATLAGSYWHIPTLLVAQLMSLWSVERISGRRAPRMFAVVTGAAVLTVMIAALAGPPAGSAMVWLVPSANPLAVALDIVAVAVAVIVLITLSDLRREAPYLVFPLVTPSAVLAAVVVLVAADGATGETKPRTASLAVAAFAAATGSAAVTAALAASAVLAHVGAHWIGQIGGLAVLAVSAVGVWAGSRRVAGILRPPPSDPLPTLLPDPPRDSSAWAALTPREREVLSLVAAGRSNAGIARELFTSPRTVDSQVSSIFVKLGIPRDPDGNQRVQAAARWIEASGAGAAPH